MNTTKLGSVFFQLDYYPSSQFAGLHLALKKGIYASKGLDVELILPTPSGGEEPDLVIRRQGKLDKESGNSYSNFPAGIFPSIPKLSIGSAEQSVILGAISRNIQVKAFATIFQESPLCLASLPDFKLSTVEDLVGKRIGMHIDSYELTACLLSHATQKFDSISIRVDERATKIEALLAGEVDAIQVYSCYEVEELEMRLGKPCNFLSLTSIVPPNSPKFQLGYGQALFAASWTLRCAASRRALTAFMEATAEGWAAARANPREAVEAVMEARAAAGFDGRPDFLVVNTPDFIRRSLLKCLDLVLPPPPVGPASPPLAAPPPRPLAIDPACWNQAARDLSRIGFLPHAVAIGPLSLSPDLWPFAVGPPAAAAPAGSGAACEVPDGKAVALAVRAEAEARAAAFRRRNGRAPRLVVVRVGEPGPAAAERLRLFSSAQHSWFSKRVVVEAAGVDYEEAVLPLGSTAAAVREVIRALNRRGDVDAVLLERPLPQGLNADELGAEIAADKNVDAESPAAPLPGARGAAPLRALAGAFTDLAAADAAAGDPAPADAALVGGAAAPWLAGDGGPGLPIFAAAALELLDRCGRAGGLAGTRATVVGRSRRLGLPLALALVARDATVTVCHRGTSPAALRAACGAADWIFAAAGAPGLVTADMLRPGVAVVNLGTTFRAADGRMLGDVDEGAAAVAGFLTPTPGGMGPMMVAGLVSGAVACAEARALSDRVRLRRKAASPPAAAQPAAPHDLAALAAAGWAVPAAGGGEGRGLVKSFGFGSFAAAVDAVVALRDAAEAANHHPTLALNRARQCEMGGSGCAVEVEWVTYSAGRVTAADVGMARVVDRLWA